MAAPRHGQAVNPGFIGAIVAAVMAGLLTFAFTNVSLFSQQIEVKAQVASADTLAPGADVEVAGVKIGTVGSIDKGDAGGALVSMKVDTSRVAIYRDASLLIRPHGVFGPKFVEIEPGNQSTGGFTPGGTIDIGKTAESVDFEQVLNELDADTRTSLQTALYNLGTGSEDRGADFGATIDNLKVVTADLVAPLQVVGNRSFETGRFIDNSATWTEVFANSPIDSIIHENADVLAKLDAKRPDLQPLVDHGEAVLADLDLITSGRNVTAL